MTLVWVAAAGSAGAVARFLVDGLIRSRRASEFPWATLIINVTGSLLLGFLVGALFFDDAPSQAEMILGTGFCGGYTTFSTASFETVRLVQRQRYWAAIGNSVGVLLLTLGAGAVGLALARL